MQDLLKELGLRLRELRVASGLSLSELARRSGVSRRTVTEAEAGRANLSIVKLASLAQTLEVSLGTLCDLNLPGAPASKRGERVALIGLRGAGKSTIGRLLARELEMPFVELDDRVSESAGLPLGEIFDLHGQDSFHRFEAQALEEVLAEGGRQVLAAGGSIVEAPSNFERLLATCTTVWLQAAPEDHYQRVWDQGDKRRMRDHSAAMSELRERLDRRRALYGRANHHVQTHGKNPSEVAQAVMECLVQGRQVQSF